MRHNANEFCVIQGKLTSENFQNANDSKFNILWTSSFSENDNKSEWFFSKLKKIVFLESENFYWKYNEQPQFSIW